MPHFDMLHESRSTFHATIKNNGDAKFGFSTIMIEERDGARSKAGAIKAGREGTADYILPFYTSSSICACVLRVVHSLGDMV